MLAHKINLKLLFLNLPLAGKITVTYIIAVLLPSLSMTIVLHYVNLTALRQMHYYNLRYEIAAASANFNMQKLQIVTATNLLQESATLLDILGGAHPSLSPTMFYYLRDVQPLLNVINANPYIQNIRIYGFDSMLVNMHFGLSSLQYMNAEEGFLDTVGGGIGKWIVRWQEEEPILKYYRILHTSTFPFRRGLLEIQANSHMLTNSFNNVDAGAFYFKTSTGDIVRYENDIFTKYNYIGQFEPDIGGLRFDIPFQNSFPRVWIYAKPMETIQPQNQFFLFVLTVITIIFTALYFLLTRSMTNRLQTFSYHIQQADIETLKPFDSDYKDEIGVVIDSYNNLVDKTNSLIHENLIVKLEKRETEYYALQSQIKPHFLYNTLENIRMSAEANSDMDTAAMITTLGRHLRYSLNISSRPVRLEDEIYSAKHYLQIHKIRMKEKIHYDIEISTEIDDVYVPKFILQPLIENSVMHGYRIEQKLHIHIRVEDGEHKPGSVVVVIQDNGNGIVPERLHQLQEKLRRQESGGANHIGLLNVNSRLCTFYSFEAEGLKLESEEGKGTKISILLERGHKVYENTDS